nr:protein bangles and beads-like [Aegilops tauschii subsp. strangulata]
MPQSDKGWSCAKLSDEQASSVLEQMKVDLKPGNARATKVTGAMLLREFFTLRVAPLQARARPLWRLGDEEDKIRLSPEALPDNELSAVLRLLVGDNQEPLPSAKKRKGDAAAAPPSAEKGGDSTRTSPARSPSRDQEERRHEESAPEVPLAPEVPMSGSAAEVPKAQEPLTATAFEKEKQAGTKAAADREAARKDAEAAPDRYRALEDELKSLRDQLVEEARGRQAKEEEMRAREDAIKDRDTELGELAKTQATERGRLEELERKVKVKEVELDAKAKVLPEDRAAFSLLEERSRVALKALEEVVDGIGPMAEAEACVLSSAALTWIFSHLHLRDPGARLDELLERVADEHYTAAAAAVKGQVEALLRKFCGFTSMPSTEGAATPAAPAGGPDEGDAIKGGVPLTGVDGVQG